MIIIVIAPSIIVNLSLAEATLEEMDIFGDSNGKSHEMKVTSHLEALENMFDETTYQSDKGLNW